MLFISTTGVILNDDDDKQVTKSAKACRRLKTIQDFFFSFCLGGILDVSNGHLSSSQLSSTGLLDFIPFSVTTPHALLFGIETLEYLSNFINNIQLIAAKT